MQSADAGFSTEIDDGLSSSTHLFRVMALMNHHRKLFHTSSRTPCLAPQLVSDQVVSDAADSDAAGNDAADNRLTACLPQIAHPYRSRAFGKAWLGAVALAASTMLCGCGTGEPTVIEPETYEMTEQEQANRQREQEASAERRQ